MASLAWRQRRNAVGKKLAPEVELLMDSEPLVMAKNHNASLESSPVSVAQMFNDFPPEMKSFILPGAWTVVGKGGRPLKNLKTYDPPKKPKKKNKSSRKAVEGELHATLAEMPSSSKCMDKLERVAVKHEKDAMRGRDARYWAHYRRAKQDKIYALDALTATLGDDGMLGDEIEPGMIERPHPMAKTQRRNKGDRHAEKVRRNARFASQAAKCYTLETDMERDEAMIRTLEWEAAQSQRSKPATCKPPSAKCKEGKAASRVSKWLPEMKQLKSMVQAVLQEEADAESIEHRCDVKKRKDEPSPTRKTGKKSKLWRDQQDGSKRCTTM